MPSVIHCRARPVRSIVALSSHGMLRYRFAALSLCRFAALPLCRFAALPLCRFAALPLCRFAALPRRFACAAERLTPARAARERASPGARP
ncbi:hypothetical protein [Burkholderia pseudomallei]|uniref:hypothetical protein n=1 Tax=Burkholderia pseudomallei TaxID=28450 RepID=UPI0009771E7C|nr:hypothetical protein [Burkholderia pseudomallei]MBD2995391.1 hypothetical protein [Burkholderia pseudomallei]MBF3769155.1 hypothetical protein [Burkholderia pseudomallei]MBO7870357.1 hypothetical protein [Burkholderia pseudomallei]MBR7786712.1 hypothetical protein [Burkholderia pseudomallei]NAW72361.1 hypothetical protein [Burkholderia pseudomallei]